MKPDQKVIVALFLFLILFSLAAAYFLPSLINTQQSFISKAKIIKFVAPGTPAPDRTEEYHLWLKIEMTLSEFNNLMAGAGSGSAGTTPVKKDQMGSGRLETENIIPDTLVIRGFGQAGMTPSGSITTTPGLPLRINKTVSLVKENTRILDDETLLASPQTIPHGKFQIQTDIYQKIEGNGVRLYVHLESGISPKGKSNLLSLTITHLKNNQAIQSQTLPAFWY